MNTRIASQYHGKSVFVGLDVHKKKYVATARCEQAVVKKWSQIADPRQLVHSLEKWFPGAQVVTCYEAGFCGFHLHRTLVAAGISCLVVNPASVEVKSNDRVKTDKRDSTKLAEHLELGRLESIYIPTEQEELTQLHTRTRSQLLENRVRVGNQIKSKLIKFGKTLEEDIKMSKSFLQKVEKLDLPFELRISVDALISVWRHLDEKIRELDAVIRKLVSTDKIHQLIMSTPGFGPIASATLVSELHNILRFRNERALWSFIGLTPCEHSSGDRRHQGHISRQGSRRLRWILTEAAWRAIAKDEVLADKFERIAARRGKKRAIVAIARTLLGRVRGCLMNAEEYKVGVTRLRLQAAS